MNLWYFPLVRAIPELPPTLQELELRHFPLIEGHPNIS
jgi:hypothetical protein